MIFLNENGAKLILVSNHNFLSRLENLVTNTPLEPSGFNSFISFLNSFVKMKSVNSQVFDIQCIPLFIKHVFPRFLSPTTPFLEFSILDNALIFSSSESYFSHFGA